MPVTNAPGDVVVRGYLLLLSLVLWPCIALAGDGFAWPQGRKAAVSLAYDDALASHLDKAIPALDRHRLKGSFYLQLSRDTVWTRTEEWRAAARNGHELGNHSVFHQCSGRGPGREWVVPSQDLDATTVAQMVAQVAFADMLLAQIDGRTQRSFTVPCGDRQAKDGDYVAAIAGRYIGIKVPGDAVVADMVTLDSAAVPVLAPEGLSGAQLIALVEEAGRKGTMVNFTFHGIGGDYLQISNEAHDELLAWLDAHRDDYWTATFGEIMQWVREQRR
jgi:peptidoglycan/xylan/chitin deacetylase (PgdA/CDA1 family)